MAKKRKTTTRKKTAPSRKKTRRPAKRAAPKRPRRPKAVELRPVRRALQADLALLESAEQNDQIRDAITRLNTCLSEIDAICGPDMMIPIG